MGRSKGVSGGVAGDAGGGVGGVIVAPKAPPGPPPPPPASVAPAVTVESESSGTPQESAAELTPERKRLESKFQPALLTLLDCWKKSPGEACAGGQSGKVEVQIWFTQVSGAVRTQLQSMGFEFGENQPSAKMMTGRIPREKLESLAQLEQVKFISLKRQ